MKQEKIDSDTPLTPSGSSAAGWRAATIACLLVMAIATAAAMSMFEQFKAQVAYLQSQLHSTPQVQYLAVLLDPKQAPAMLVTYSPQEGALQVQRLNDVKEGRDDSLYLWGLADGGKPRLLGVLESKAKTLQVPAQLQNLQGVTQLAISVESKSAVVPASTPALPYLFIGAWVQKAL
jgi:anti-sigma-K factor RskA